MMARRHIKRLFAVSLTLMSFCLLVIFLLHHHMSRPYDLNEPNVDVELMKMFEIPTKTVRFVKPTPPERPQIHVKDLPTMTLNINMSLSKIEDTFFRYLENKDIKCENDQRLGNQHDGGWNVCLSPPYKMQQSHPCVVFSFGIGYNWQFDDAITTLFSCDLLAFDPSMKEPDGRLNSLIQFHRLGIGAKNEVTKDGWKLKTLGTHLSDSGYEGKPVDYVKIDVEYTEWGVLKTAFAEGSLKNVKQLGFEIHTPQFLFEKQEAEKDDMSKKLDFVHMFETLRQVEILGFKKFNYRKNPFGDYVSDITQKDRSCCYELHYINTEFLNSNHTILHRRDSGLFH